MRSLIKRLLGRKVIGWLRGIVYSPSRSLHKYFNYDEQRFLKYSGAFGHKTREQKRAYIIMLYHVIEKGLTMPNRHLCFGRDIVCGLMNQVAKFEEKYGADDQVVHAVGVLKAYWDLHSESAAVQKDDGFWRDLKSFLDKRAEIQVSIQPHYTRAEFYKNREARFPEFAFARHTLRHYSAKPLNIEKLRSAVQIAASTPTACNRQYCRVYCLSDKHLMAEVLALQGGNRGFGHLADKLLIVTANLEGICLQRERTDLFVNGGMFLMNLCYSLYYHEIAYCILNWSRLPEEDLRFRQLVKIKDSDTVMAIITCGETPDEFDVCASPRKSVEEFFVEL